MCSYCPWSTAERDVKQAAWCSAKQVRWPKDKSTITESGCQLFGPILFCQWAIAIVGLQKIIGQKSALILTVGLTTRSSNESELKVKYSEVLPLWGFSHRWCFCMLCTSCTLGVMDTTVSTLAHGSAFFSWSEAGQMVNLVKMPMKKT